MYTYGQININPQTSGVHIPLHMYSSVCVYVPHMYIPDVFVPPLYVLVSVPPPQSEDLTGRVVEDMEGASQANQRRMNADPLEVMLLNMGYRITGLSSGGAGASDDEDSSEGQVQCRPS